MYAYVESLDHMTPNLDEYYLYCFAMLLCRWLTPSKGQAPKLLNSASLSLLVAITLESYYEFKSGVTLFPVMLSVVYIFFTHCIL